MVHPDHIQVIGVGNLRLHGQGLKSGEVRQGLVIAPGNGPAPEKPVGEFLELTDSQGTLDIGEAVIVTQVSHLIEPGTEFFTLMEVGGNAMVAD